MMSVNLSYIAILNIQSFDDRCLISLTSKNKPIKFFSKCCFNWKMWKIIT